MKEGNVEMWKAYDAAITRIGMLERLLSNAQVREKAIRSGISSVREQLQNQGLEGEAFKLESLLAKHPVPYMTEAASDPQL